MFEASKRRDRGLQKVRILSCLEFTISSPNEEWAGGLEFQVA